MLRHTTCTCIMTAYVTRECSCCCLAHGPSHLRFPAVARILTAEMQLPALNMRHCSLYSSTTTRPTTPGNTADGGTTTAAGTVCCCALLHTKIRASWLTCEAAHLPSPPSARISPLIPAPRALNSNWTQLAR
eukprot:GHRR01027796.1.p1 GENE.GHRR01027796.1~~GHRR01027796.1.p1  ORF type:complete len:132 (-),score=27.01 GHRR01027796.1:20-415(-)